MSYRDARYALLALAADQGGFFTARQALAVGYSYPEQHYHVTQGNWIRVVRGIFRLREYPLPERSDLIVLSLLSADRLGEPQAVVSHETALALHELGDANPARVHLTVPPGFRKRLPVQVILHRAHLTDQDWEDWGGYRVTTPLRTLRDIAGSAESWPFLEDAVREALERGLVRRSQILAGDIRQPALARLREALKTAEQSEQPLGRRAGQ